MNNTSPSPRKLTLYFVSTTMTTSRLLLAEQ
jgi:hypothetical protein